jgi:hypothetical protein
MTTTDGTTDCSQLSTTQNLSKTTPQHKWKIQLFKLLLYNNYDASSTTTEPGAGEAKKLSPAVQQS